MATKTDPQGACSRFFKVVFKRLSPLTYLGEHSDDVGLSQPTGVKHAHLAQGFDGDQIRSRLVGRGVVGASVRGETPVDGTRQINRLAVAIVASKLRSDYR